MVKLKKKKKQVYGTKYSKREEKIIRVHIKRLSIL